MVSFCEDNGNRESSYGCGNNRWVEEGDVVNDQARRSEVSTMKVTREIESGFMTSHMFKLIHLFRTRKRLP
jgi:hypothetical protein